ncbi:MAG: CHASE3 domain-containing protein, partial [Actinomycetota bacterium]
MRLEGRRGSLRMVLGRLVAAVGIAGAALVGLSIAGMLLASNGYRDAGVEAVTRQAAANQILIDLLNAETGNRGYILTGRGDYLTPYTAARDRYEPDIARMRDLVRGEPTLELQLERVDRTAELWFAEAVEQIRLRRRDKDEAIARVNEGVGRARLEAFRATHAELLSEVQRVREDSLSRADLTRTVTLLVISAAALGALLVVIVAVIQLWRRIGVPVALVADGVARVARGRFTDPVPESDAAVAELAQLTTGFNEMQSQLSRQRDAVALAARREAAQHAERRLWETLQTGLLPLDLPRVPGLRVVARYEPAERGLLIGGDFYDAVLLRDGRLALAVGDLAGHGAPVAA